MHNATRQIFLASHDAVRYIMSELNIFRMSRIIKRYENRKLYDTEYSRYISLEHVANLIKAGETVQIIDKDGNDLTNQMLTQIILEQGKKGNAALPDELLHELIRWGSKMVDDGVNRLRDNMELLIRDSVTRLFSAPKQDEVHALQSKIDQLENTLEQLSAKYQKLSEQHEQQS